MICWERCYLQRSANVKQKQSILLSFLAIYLLSLILLRVGQELGGSFKDGGPQLKTPRPRIWRTARAHKLFSVRPQPFCPPPGTPRWRWPHWPLDSLPSLWGSLPDTLATSFSHSPLATQCWQAFMKHLLYARPSAFLIKGKHIYIYKT